MQENFKPIKHFAQNTWYYKIIFLLRLLIDFQFSSIYKVLKKELPRFKGNVLDIGCGNSPFKVLLDNNETSYTGIDINYTDTFEYKNNDIIHFDGNFIPFGDHSFDNIIMTEVLEHVFDPTQLISEIHRVLKEGGKCIITIPWSARYHYIPFDFHRYSPSCLSELFNVFKNIDIKPRGTDITSIAAKSIVVYFSILKSLLRFSVSDIIYIPLKILFLFAGCPFLFFLILLGQLSLRLKLGSDNDPLGYTIIINK